MACVMRIRDRWAIDFYDQQGKRHRIFMPKGTTKREANEKLGEIEKKIRQGLWVSPREVPYFNEFADTWLASKKLSIRHSTYEQYRGHVENYLKPYFAGVKLNQINFDSIEKFKKHCLETRTVSFDRALNRYRKRSWFEELKILSGGDGTGSPGESKEKIEEARTKILQFPPEEQRRFESVLRYIKNFEKTVSIATLRKILITLGSILSYAVKMRYIDYNPIREVEKPKGKKLRDERKEMIILKPEEIRKLLESARDEKSRIFLMMAVLTGAREGELLGLKWEDIDWLNSQILIRRTYNHGRFMDPKSKHSERRIDVGPALLHELKKWKLACPKGELDLVFPSEKGTPWPAQNMIRQTFLPALRRAGLPRINFHCLRHTYASLLIEQGENPKYIQTQMGHHSINITMDIYGHLFKQTNQASARKLAQNILGDDLKSNPEVFNKTENQVQNDLDKDLWLNTAIA